MKVLGLMAVTNEPLEPDMLKLYKGTFHKHTCKCYMRLRCLLRVMNMATVRDMKLL